MQTQVQNTISRYINDSHLFLYEILVSEHLYNPLYDYYLSTQLDQCSRDNDDFAGLFDLESYVLNLDDDNNDSFVTALRGKSIACLFIPLLNAYKTFEQLQIEQTYEKFRQYIQNHMFLTISEADAIIALQKEIQAAL